MRSLNNLLSHYETDAGSYVFLPFLPNIEGSLKDIRSIAKVKVKKKSIQYLLKNRF